MRTQFQWCIQISIIEIIQNIIAKAIKFLRHVPPTICGRGHVRMHISESRLGRQVLISYPKAEQKVRLLVSQWHKVIPICTEKVGYIWTDLNIYANMGMYINISPILAK